MQRLTVFFIGAGITIVVVTAALLGVKYMMRHNAEVSNGQNAVVAGQNTGNGNNVVESNKPEGTTDSNMEIGDTDSPKIIDTPANNPLASISEEKIIKAGFLEAGLEVSAFPGTVFDKIDFSEYNDDEHLQYKILENNINSGIICELIFPDADITANVYEILKSQISGNTIFTVNETSQYGDKSFFANNVEEKNSVFLVVKKGNRLYTFLYPARNHNKIKNLIGLL